MIVLILVAVVLVAAITLSTGKRFNKTKEIDSVRDFHQTYKQKEWTGITAAARKSEYSKNNSKQVTKYNSQIDYQEK